MTPRSRIGVERGRRVEALDQHDRGARGQREAEHHVEAEDVEQRQDAEHDVVGASCPGVGAALLDVGQQVAVGEHRRLRRAGGAAGEQQHGDGARLELRDAERLAIEVVVERQPRRRCCGRRWRRRCARSGPTRVDRSPRLARHRADHHRHGAHRGELLTRSLYSGWSGSAEQRSRRDRPPRDTTRRSNARCRTAGRPGRRHLFLARRARRVATRLDDAGSSTSSAGSD